MITALMARIMLLRRTERDAGVTAVEYALVLVLLLVAITGAIGAFATDLSNVFNNVGNDLFPGQ
jgi:Flp pilus assembly pilin Flp